VRKAERLLPIRQKRKGGGKKKISSRQNISTLPLSLSFRVGGGGRGERKKGSLSDKKVVPSSPLIEERKKGRGLREVYLLPMEGGGGEDLQIRGKKPGASCLDFKRGRRGGKKKGAKKKKRLTSSLLS